MVTSFFSQLLGSWAGVIGLSFFLLINRKKAWVQATVLLAAAVIIPAKITHYYPLAKNYFYEQKEEVIVAAKKKVEEAKEKATKIVDDSSKKLSLLKDELVSGIKKSSRKLENKFDRHFRPKKYRKNKLKCIAWVCAKYPIKVVWWLLRSKLVQLAITMGILYYLWKLPQSFQKKGNRGHGGNLRFGRFQRNNHENEENFPNENPQNQNVNSNNVGGLNQTILNVLPLEAGISEFDDIWWWGFALGIEDKFLRNRFAYSVQNLQRDVREGRATQRELDLFVQEKGNLLLPGEALVPGLSSHDTLQRRLRALDVQERIRQRQRQLMQQRLNRHLDLSVERHREHRDRRNDYLQNIRDRAQNQIQNRQEQARANRCRARRENELRQEREERNNRHQQAQAQARAEQQRLRQEREEERRERREEEGNQPDEPGGNMIDQNVIIEGQGNGGNRRGGNNEDPFLVVEDEGNEGNSDLKPDHNAYDFVQEVIEKTAISLSQRTGEKIAEEVIEKVTEGVFENLAVDSAKTFMDRVFSDVSVSFTEVSVEEHMSELGMAIDRQRKLFPELFYTHQGVTGVENAVEETVSQGVQTSVKTVASKFCKGAAIGIAVKYGFSAAKTLKRCYDGKNENYNNSKGGWDTVQTTFQEIYADRPPILEVAEDVIVGTAGAMIGQALIPIPVVGGVVGGVCANYGYKGAKRLGGWLKSWF